MKHRAARQNRAFTMVEVLVVIAIIAMLAVVLFPVINHKSVISSRPQCLFNLKQLTVAWLMYSQDNNGALPFAAGYLNSKTNAWALGNAQTAPQDTGRYGQLDPGVLDATNLHALTRGVLFDYVKNSSVYHCPRDSRTVAGVPYVRSYSMNNWMNGHSPALWLHNLSISNHVYKNNFNIPSPARRFVFADEDPESINDTMFTVIVDRGNAMSSIPSRNHQPIYFMGFADGHVDAFKFLCPDTLTWNPSKPHPPEIASDGTTNLDLLRLRDQAYAPW